MKWFTIVLLMLLASSATAQIVVTAEDVEIQFVADPTEQWRSVVNIQIEDSTEEIGIHDSRGRLGSQHWKVLKQADEPELGIWKISFDLDDLPAPTFRVYVTRTRARDGVYVSDWVVSDSVRILGKTGKAAHN